VTRPLRRANGRSGIRPARIGAWAIALAIAAGAARPAPAEPASGRAGAAARIAAIAPADDARRAVVIGPGGEVYEPDGKGGWVHRLASSTADRLVSAGHTGGRGGSVVALGDGVVYRLARNGWSAIRLAQKGKAILGSGPRALAAVGRQLFALDALTRGEPTKLAMAAGNILAIGAGPRGAVVATDAGAWRLAGKELVALDGAPPRMRLVSERWAIVDRGAIDLGGLTAQAPAKAGAKGAKARARAKAPKAPKPASVVAWPAGLTIGAAAVAPDGALVAVGSTRDGLELVTLRGGKLARDPLGIAGSAVGVVVDRAGRAAVALSDGRIAVRDKARWTTTEVTAEAPAEHPGAPPAASN
jgi:hypothetical protein